MMVVEVGSLQSSLQTGHVSFLALVLQMTVLSKYKECQYSQLKCITFDCSSDSVRYDRLVLDKAPAPTNLASCSTISSRRSLCSLSWPRSLCHFFPGIIDINSQTRTAN